MASLPLTRAASLPDYEDCDSVAVWQQCLAIDAYHRWHRDSPTYLCDDVLCYNWGAARFRAPGANPRYRSFGDPELSLDVSAVFALSVLDRVEAPLRFLRHQVDRLMIGGLIVCTFAAWDATGEDCAVGHELRHRIYDRESWRKLVHEAKSLGLQPFGGVDLRYHGHALGDHTLATLVATKERWNGSWRK